MSKFKMMTRFAIVTGMLVIALLGGVLVASAQDGMDKGDGTTDTADTTDATTETTTGDAEQVDDTDDDDELTEDTAELVRLRPSDFDRPT